MNNIKFRVWDKVLGKYTNHCNDTLTFQTGPSPIRIYEAFRLETFEGYKGLEVDNQAKYWNDFVIQQFTGLLSKNNQEIYEGDILTYILQKDGEILQIDKGIVEWSNAAFILNGEKFGKEKVFLGDYVMEDNKTELEILGNIFEN